MASNITRVYLNDEEQEKLKELVSSDVVVACTSGSEFFRLLLHREFNRRRGLPAPMSKDWQRDFRISHNTGRKFSKATRALMKKSQKKRRRLEKKKKAKK